MMGKQPLFFELSLLSILEKYIKCPVFINFFGVLRNLHDLKAREKGNDEDEKENHVQVLSLFLHLVIISTFLNPVFM